MKLGSLFSGSGGFEFAAQQSGMEPVWASEIEPFPIAVTRKRFPNMKHLGDVSRISGAELEPVDIITFGSPCQDLSVAGKRAGLDGERSGLFKEAIRIIKEMREATDGRYPKYAIFENVPGAFSSAGGEDFRAVLQAFVGIKDETANVPRPSGGKWNTAGEIVGDGYSVAWRVLDAQYWGVPQRRRRIFLVADFRSGRAGRILFEREGLRRDFAEIKQSWEESAAPAQTCVGDLREPYTAQLIRERCGCEGGGKGLLIQDDLSGAIATSNDQFLFACYDTRDHENRVMDYTAVVVGIDPYNAATTGDKAATLGVNCGLPNGRNGVVYAMQRSDEYAESEIASTLSARQYKSATDLVIALDRAAYNQGQNARYDMGIDESGKAYTVVAKGPGAVCYAVDCRNATLQEVNGTLQAKPNGGTSYNLNNVVLIPAKIILRRLTPTECARLQGMPDWWVDGIENPNPTEDDMRFWREVFETHRRIVTGASKPKTDKQIRKWLANPHSDSAEYKMWGNGVALPCVLYVMEGIAREMEEI